MAQTADSLATRVGDIAAGPASATNSDGSSVTQQSVSDAIKAQEFQARREAVAANRMPFGVFRVRSPGGEG